MKAKYLSLIFLSMFFFLSAKALEYSSVSVNSTIAGSVCEFKMRWYDAKGLSGYIFSLDNCEGIFTNYSFFDWSLKKQFNQSKMDLITGINLSSQLEALNTLGEGLTYDVQESEMSKEEIREIVKGPSYFLISPFPWENPENAFYSDDQYAMTDKKDSFQDYGYNFTLPNNARIISVFVGFEAFTSGNERLEVKVSWDGGNNWGGYTFDLPTSDTNTTTWINFTNITRWTPEMLNDTNFRVRIKSVAVGAMKEIYLDYLPVNITYSIPPTYQLEVWHESSPITYEGILNSLSIIVNFTSNTTKFYKLQAFDWNINDWVQEGCNSGLVHADTPTLWKCNFTSNPIRYISPNNKVRIRIMSLESNDQAILKEDYVQYFITFSPTEGWSIFTTTLSSNVGCNVRWMVYANNSLNEWNSSEILSFQTTSSAYCGNGACDSGETCSNCLQDCPCPGSPGCCGNQCGCPSGQVCQNNVCVTPSPPPSLPPPPCDPSKDFVCCVQRYPQGCCDCPSFGYKECSIIPFNQTYEDCKKLCMKLCPGGCSLFTNSSSCINAGCNWCQGYCQEEVCLVNCSLFTNSSSCINAGCNWCENECKEFCLINWSFVISARVKTFKGQEANATIEIKNEGEKSFNNVALRITNISPEVFCTVFPEFYQKIMPNETKSFTLSCKSEKVGNYEIEVNITSDEAFHLTRLNLIVQEPKEIPSELLNMTLLLWIATGLIIMLIVVSYKLYMRKVQTREKPLPEKIKRPKKVRKAKRKK